MQSRSAILVISRRLGRLKKPNSRWGRTDFPSDADFSVNTLPLYAWNWVRQDTLETIGIYFRHTRSPTATSNIPHIGHPIKIILQLAELPQVRFLNPQLFNAPSSHLSLSNSLPSFPLLKPAYPQITVHNEEWHHKYPCQRNRWSNSYRTCYQRASRSENMP
jgi:hypothetical protein